MDDVGERIVGIEISKDNGDFYEIKLLGGDKFETLTDIILLIVKAQKIINNNQIISNPTLG